MDNMNTTAAALYAKLPASLRRRVCQDTVWQACRFGLVGLGATLTHIGVYSGLTLFAGVSAFSANFIAFAVAIVVSFTGNFFWTFEKQCGNSRFTFLSLRFAKFMFTQLSGLGLNSLFVWLTVDVLRLPSIYAVGPMFFITPLAGFLLNKFWVFGTASSASSCGQAQ